MAGETTTILNFGALLGPSTGPAQTMSATDNVDRLVREAVTEACQEGPQDLRAVRNAPTLPPPLMLRILTYCYAHRLLASEEITFQLWADPGLKSACAEEIPDAQTLRRFRRLNRQTLQSNLENALRKVRHALARITLSHRLCGGSEIRPKPALVPLTASAGENTTILVCQEAAQRIEAAMVLDSGLADE